MATLKEIYENVKARGGKVPDTYEKFHKFMTSGPGGGYEHRKRFYDTFSKAGVKLGSTYEDFSKGLFAPTKSASGGGSRSAVAGSQSRDAAGALGKSADGTGVSLSGSHSTKAASGGSAACLLYTSDAADD